MRISSFKIKDGPEVQVGNITILVGPNNVGKSRMLEDILSIVLKKSANVVLEKITLEKPSDYEKIFEGLQTEEAADDKRPVKVVGLGPELSDGKSKGIFIEQLKLDYRDYTNGNFMLSHMPEFLVAFLNASTRLRLARMDTACNPYETAPSSLLQALYVSKVQFQSNA